jgi:hypothetical protein
MTKTVEDQAQFIELRAKGLSFQSISERIGISKPVLFDWAKDFDAKIKEQRAWELQTLLEKYNASKMARLENFAKLLQAIQAELDARIDEDRGFYNVPTEKLLSMAVILDKRLGGEVDANTVEYGGLTFDDGFKGVDIELD